MFCYRHLRTANSYVLDFSETDATSAASCLSLELLSTSVFSWDKDTEEAVTEAAWFKVSLSEVDSAAGFVLLCFPLVATVLSLAATALTFSSLCSELFFLALLLSPLL